METLGPRKPHGLYLAGSENCSWTPRCLFLSASREDKNSPDWCFIGSLPLPFAYTVSNYPLGNWLFVGNGCLGCLLFGSCLFYCSTVIASFGPAHAMQVFSLKKLSKRKTWQTTCLFRTHFNNTQPPGSFFVGV